MDQYLKTDDIDLRIAEPLDLDLACSLRRECMCAVFGHDVDDTLDELVARNRRAFERGFSDGTTMMLFAYFRDSLAGCGVACLGNEMPSLDNPSGIDAILMNIYTRPQFRKKGIATTLTRALIELARNEGADKIVLDATSAGAPLYRRLGFVDYEGYMVLGGIQTR